MKTAFIVSVLFAATWLDGCCTQKPTENLTNGSYESFDVQPETGLMSHRPAPVRLQWNVGCAVRCDRTLIELDEEVFALDGVKTFYEDQLGLYPKIDLDQEGNIVFVNGGLPQIVVSDSVLLNLHLTKVEEFITTVVPVEWSGYAVIDYEDWIPIWTEGRRTKNLYQLESKYKTASVMHEMERQPNLSRSQATELAKMRFEKSGIEFMLATLGRAQELRPNAQWGYYGYPGRARRWNDDLEELKRQNSGLKSLFDQSDALYPSIYMLAKTKNIADSGGNRTEEETKEYVTRNLVEAIRVSNGSPVVPFAWYRYHNRGGNNEFGGHFLSEIDAYYAFVYPFEYRIKDVIIWGSSSDRASDKKPGLQHYFDSTLTPLLKDMARSTTPFDSLE